MLAKGTVCSNKLIKSYYNMNTNQVGKMTEVNVLSYLVNRGYSISLPFGDKDRYDQIWDINNKLYKVQIKTSRWIDEEHSGIVFSCYTVCNGKRHFYQSDEVDLFATYFDNKLYVIPIDECSTEKKLRFSSKQPNQPSINWAKDYEFEEVIKRL